MPVDDPNVVDAVGVDRVSGEAVLTIADVWTWDDSHGHLLVLQTKINRYLEFIDQGELLENVPAAQGRALRIDVIFKHPPDAEGERFLDQAADVVSANGWSLTWRWFPGDEPAG